MEIGATLKEGSHGRKALCNGKKKSIRVENKNNVYNDDDEWLDHEFTL